MVNCASIYRRVFGIHDQLTPECKGKKIVGQYPNHDSITPPKLLKYFHVFVLLYLDCMTYETLGAILRSQESWIVLTVLLVNSYIYFLGWSLKN